MAQETGPPQCLNLVKIQNGIKLEHWREKGLRQSWKKGIAGAAGQEQGAGQSGGPGLGWWGGCRAGAKATVKLCGSGWHWHCETTARGDTPSTSPGAKHWLR